MIAFRVFARRATALTVALVAALWLIAPRPTWAQLQLTPEMLIGGAVPDAGP